MYELFIPYFNRNLLDVLVSSAAIKLTFDRICNALNDISNEFPIGVGITYLIL